MFDRKIIDIQDGGGSFEDLSEQIDKVLADPMESCALLGWRCRTRFWKVKNRFVFCSYKKYDQERLSKSLSTKDLKRTLG